MKEIIFIKKNGPKCLSSGEGTGNAGKPIGEPFVLRPKNEKGGRKTPEKKTGPTRFKSKRLSEEESGVGEVDYLPGVFCRRGRKKKTRGERASVEYPTPAVRLNVATLNSKTTQAGDTK